MQIEKKNCSDEKCNTWKVFVLLVFADFIKIHEKLCYSKMRLWNFWKKTWF